MKISNEDQLSDLKARCGQGRFEASNYSNTDFKHITKTQQVARTLWSA